MPAIPSQNSRKWGARLTMFQDCVKQRGSLGYEDVKKVGYGLMQGIGRWMSALWAYTWPSALGVDVEHIKPGLQLQQE